MFNLLAAVTLAIAVQGTYGVAVYGQCGGKGYSGSTVCDSGSVWYVIISFQSHMFAKLTYPSALSVTITTRSAFLAQAGPLHLPELPPRNHPLAPA
jgi:hypothetical protein